MKYIFFSSVYCVCVILVFSCTKQNFPSADSDIISTEFIPFTDRETAGILENESIDESSGLASSNSFPGYLWTHNDSGDEARLFLLDETGNHVSEIKISGAVNRDWEDIASGVDPVTQKNYILIADIGDNFGKYDFVTLYQILEPDVLPEKDTSLAVSKKMTIKYPNGPRDAETLIIDPLTQDIFILSKREPQIFVYQISYPYPNTDTIIPEKKLTLPYTQLVGGDISRDGQEILLKNYDEIYYFKRESEESITYVLQKMPLKLVYTREPQGEAVCFSKDGKSFFTLSEKSVFGVTPLLYRYRRK